MTIRRAATVLLIVFLSLATFGFGQISVLTQHNDNGRTGQNLNETILNTSNVNQNTFGKLFWRTVDGYIYAQPLYVSGLDIQGTRNVVYVATEHNSVYAFDADDPSAVAPLWQVNFGTPVPSQDICIITGDTNPQDCPYLDINPEIGITSTPVIDPAAGIIYVVARTKNTADNSYHYHLHALDWTSGVERLGGPVEITGQVSGNGAGSQGGVVTFDPTFHNQRPALLLSNGVIYVAFGAVGDIGTFHGWIMSYDAATLQPVAVFSVTPNGSDGGIWQSGQGLVADGANNVYLMTGNGDFDANVAGGDYGDSFVKFSGPSLAVADYFTPWNQGTLSADDTDLGAGGPMLLPGTSLLVGMGKDKLFRVVDGSDMGQYNSNFDNDVQEFTASAGPFFSSPIYWNSPNNGPIAYIWGPGDFLKALKFTGSKFQTAPVSQGTIQNSSGFSNAAALSVSANGSLAGTGIVWSSRAISGVATGPSVPGVVSAFDATDLTKQLWNSTQNLTRDDVGNYAKFNAPTIANGKMYVGSFTGQLQVYGLNPPPASGIQFVQVAAATPQSTTGTVNVAYPGAQAAGNLNVVVVGWNDTTATVQSVTDSVGNSYALAFGPTMGTGLSQSIYYAKNIAGSGSNIVTVVFNQGATKPDVRILEYSGVDPSNPLDVAVGASGNSNIADSGFVTTAAPNELVVGADIVHSNTTIVAGAPFTARIISSTDSDIAEDRLVNVPGSYHSWAPLNAPGQWVMQMVTFSAVSGSVPIATSTSLSGLPNPATFRQAVTLTATITPTPTGTSTGTVSFYNGTTVLGTAAVSLSGVATFVTTNLPMGSDTLTAAYSGNVIFSPSTSSALAFTVQAAPTFTVTALQTSLTLTTGGSGKVTVTVSPVGGAFSAVVTMSASGLPSGANVSFNPGTVTPGSAGQSTIMTIQTSTQTSSIPANPNSQILLASISLVAGLSLKSRRKLARKQSMVLFAFVMLVGGALMMSGCQGSGAPKVQTQSYAITVSGTSGAVRSSTPVTLLVQ